MHVIVSHGRFEFCSKLYFSVSFVLFFYLVLIGMPVDILGEKRRIVAFWWANSWLEQRPIPLVQYALIIQLKMMRFKSGDS